MGIMDRIKEEAASAISASQNTTQQQYAMPQQDNKKYVVLQVTLKEKLIGTGSGNLTELENVINRQAAMGYRLHTISTASGGSAGIVGGDRIQATLVFERI